jgi:hypothetical protein
VPDRKIIAGASGMTSGWNTVAARHRRNHFCRHAADSALRRKWASRDSPVSSVKQLS